jgi:hypothetical protein
LIFICLFVISRCWYIPVYQVYRRQYLDAYLVFLNIEKNLISLNVDIYLTILNVNGDHYQWHRSICICLSDNSSREDIPVLSGISTSIFICLSDIPRWKFKTHISRRRYVSYMPRSWDIPDKTGISWCWYLSFLSDISRHEYVSVYLIFLNVEIYLFYQVYRHRYLYLLICLFVISQRWEKSNISQCWYLSVYLVFLNVDIIYSSVYLVFLDVERNLISLDVDMYLFIWYFSTLREISYPLTLIFIYLSGISRRWEKSHILWRWYLSIYLVFLDVERNLISFDVDIYLFIWYFSTLREISYLLTSIFICLSGISQRWEISYPLTLIFIYLSGISQRWEISYPLTLIFIYLSGISQRWEISYPLTLIFFCLFVISRHRYLSVYLVFSTLIEISQHRYLFVYLVFLDVNRNPISLYIDIYLSIYLLFLTVNGNPLTSIFICLSGISRRWEKSHILWRWYLSVNLVYLERWYYSVYLVFLERWYYSVYLVYLERWYYSVYLVYLDVDITLCIWYISTLIFIYLSVNLVFLDVDGNPYLSTLIFIRLSGIFQCRYYLFLCYSGISRRKEKPHIS